MHALDLTAASFAEHLDIPDYRLTRVLKGKTAPSAKLLAKVRRTFPHVRSDWLLIGEGAMFASTASVTCTASPASGPGPPGNAIEKNLGVAIQLVTYNVNGCDCHLTHHCHTTELLHAALRDKERIIELLLEQRRSA